MEYYQQHHMYLCNKLSRKLLALERIVDFVPHQHFEAHAFVLHLF